MSMKRSSMVALVLPALFVSSVSLGEPIWPAGALEKDDARVLAFYSGICTQWADQNGLTGDAHDAYLAKCRADVPAIFPVGYEEGGDGGDE
jgi:hypothetical protein